MNADLLTELVTLLNTVVQGERQFILILRDEDSTSATLASTYESPLEAVGALMAAQDAVIARRGGEMGAEVPDGPWKIL